MELIPNCMQSLGMADSGTGKYITPGWALGDEIHTLFHICAFLATRGGGGMSGPSIITL